MLYNFATMKTYYHGSNREITELTDDVMFFTPNEDEAADFAESTSNNEQRICHLYKIELPDTFTLETIDEFGLFDCAYSNSDLIKTDGWHCLENDWIAIKNPSTVKLTLVTKWESGKVLDEEFTNRLK